MGLRCKGVIPSGMRPFLVQVTFTHREIGAEKVTTDNPVDQTQDDITAQAEGAPVEPQWVSREQHEKDMADLDRKYQSNWDKGLNAIRRDTRADFDRQLEEQGRIQQQRQALDSMPEDVRPYVEPIYSEMDRLRAAQVQQPVAQQTSAQRGGDDNLNAYLANHNLALEDITDDGWDAWNRGDQAAFMQSATRSIIAKNVSQAPLPESPPGPNDTVQPRVGGQPRGTTNYSSAMEVTRALVRRDITQAEANAFYRQF